jgi:AcrR family transcriptional regulator
VATRELLLQTALGVFAERGADGGSMREIARRAGVNVATAYHHFDSKRDLLLTIFREMFIDVADYEDAWGPPPDDPKDALQALLHLSLAYLALGADVLRLAIAEGLKGDEEILAVFEHWQQKGDRAIENQLLRGGLATPNNVARRAWTVRQVIWGAFTAALIGGPLDNETFARQARDAADELFESWK